MRGRSTRRQGVGTRQLLASAPIRVNPGLSDPRLEHTAWRSLVKYDAWVARFTPSRMIMHCACLLPLENGNRRLPGTRSTRTGAVSRAPKFKPRPPTAPGLPGLPFSPPWPSRAVYAASAIQSKPSSPPTPPGRPGWNSPHVPSPHLQEVLASPGTYLPTYLADPTPKPAKSDLPRDLAPGSPGQYRHSLQFHIPPRDLVDPVCLFFIPHLPLLRRLSLVILVITNPLVTLGLHSFYNRLVQPLLRSFRLLPLLLLPSPVR